MVRSKCNFYFLFYFVFKNLLWLGIEKSIRKDLVISCMHTTVTFSQQTKIYVKAQLFFNSDCIHRTYTT